MGRAIALPRIKVKRKARKPPGPNFIQAVFWTCLCGFNMMIDLLQGNFASLVWAIGQACVIGCWWPCLRSYGYAMPDVRFAIGAIAVIPIGLAVSLMT